MKKRIRVSVANFNLAEIFVQAEFNCPRNPGECEHGSVAVVAGVMRREIDGAGNLKTEYIEYDLDEAMPEFAEAIRVDGYQRLLDEYDDYLKNEKSGRELRADYIRQVAEGLK
jgi:hypothetical protein